MKDIIITSKRIKKEFIFWLICFFIAFAINLSAIFIYKTPWYEVFSQLGYVVVISLSIYLITFVVRIIFNLALIPIRRIRNK